MVASWLSLVSDSSCLGLVVPRRDSIRGYTSRLKQLTGLGVLLQEQADHVLLLAGYLAPSVVRSCNGLPQKDDGDQHGGGGSDQDKNHDEK